MCTFCMKLSCAKTLCKKNPVNRHNCRLWGTENPYVLFEKPPVSVCFFVHVSGVIGPYFFTYPTVNVANYLDMLHMYAIDDC